MKIKAYHILIILLLCHGCTTVEYVQQQQPTTTTPRAKPYRVGEQWYFPMSHAHGYKEVGIASWYGDPFHGKKTSSGETYDMNTISAAHKLLPLGTLVRVKNLHNNLTLDLRINDRGPFIAGRIIDLSYAAAQQLGVVSPGTAKVEVIALGTPAPAQIQRVQRSESWVDTMFGGFFGEQPDNSVTYAPPPQDYYNGSFMVQVGAFSDLKNAQNLSQNLKKTYGYSQVVSFRRGDQTFYRVLVGKYSTIDQVHQYELALKERGFPDAFAIAE